MDLSNLKQAAETIELSADARARIAENCRETLQKENFSMNTKRTRRMPRALIAAALVLCIGLPAGMAATNTGFFRDITNWQGAITGTVYEQATNEIAVTVTAAADTLTIEADFRNPDTAPYRELETFALGAYEIRDAAGTVVAEGESSEPAAVADNGAALTVPFDAAPGAYTLVIESFVGGSKADQPLPITGHWEIAFSVN